MAQRATIGHNPLTEPVVRAEVPFAPQPVRHEQPSREPRRGDKPRNAIGGRLELLGGDLGRSTLVIRLSGDGRIGLYASQDEFIDLADQIESIAAWRDRTDHPFTAAIGWGWAFSMAAGLPGAAIGFGARMLQPRHMIFEMRLRDRRLCVGRTDEITFGALDAITRDRAADTPR
ncbi:MAG TPA: hypothetical protein VGG57_15850 [Stellaceae bacterium]|jgi:hypothetical protein